MLPGLEDEVKRSSSASPSPTLTYPLPPLPKIGGDNDILLDIYTHRSLRGDTQLDNDEYGDIWRLSDLGQQIFSTASTIHYFSRRPLEGHEHIVCLRRDALCDQKIFEMSRYYNIMKHLKGGSKSKPLEDDAEELRHFWYSYVGALYLRNGLEVVQAWVSRVIDPHMEPPQIRSGPPSPSTSSLPPMHQPLHIPNPGPPPVNYAYTSQFNGHAPPMQPPPPPAQMQEPSEDGLNPPPFTAQPNGNPQNAPMYSAPQGYNNGPPIHLSLFHETAMKYGYEVSYVPTHEGLAHALRWTVRCFLNGTERGIGVGTNQKAAKSEAAKHAWIAMGWGLY